MDKVLFLKRRIFVLVGILWTCASFLLSGCKDWHEAEGIVATADSLDAAHEVYSDTVALRRVVKQWDIPIVRTIKHNPLGRAYYYLGRNYDDFNGDYASAAQCYIRSDQLGMDSPLTRGRVNACMGYICSQHNADSLALWYNDRALRYFQTAADSFYSASALLTLSVSYASQGDYAKSDSLWQAAGRYALSDDAFEAYRCDSRIYYYMHRSAYDSALVWLQKVAPTTSLRMVQRAIAWEHTGRMDSAVWYAEQVIAQSEDRSHRVGRTISCISRLSPMGICCEPTTLRLPEWARCGSRRRRWRGN